MMKLAVSRVDKGWRRAVLSVRVSHVSVARGSHMAVESVTCVRCAHHTCPLHVSHVSVACPCLSHVSFMCRGLWSPGVWAAAPRGPPPAMTRPWSVGTGRSPQALKRAVVGGPGFPHSEHPPHWWTIRFLCLILIDPSCYHNELLWLSW